MSVMHCCSFFTRSCIVIWVTSLSFQVIEMPNSIGSLSSMALLRIFLSTLKWWLRWIMYSIYLHPIITKLMYALFTANVTKPSIQKRFSRIMQQEKKAWSVGLCLIAWQKTDVNHMWRSWRDTYQWMFMVDVLSWAHRAHCARTVEKITKTVTTPGILWTHTNFTWLLKIQTVWIT